MPRGRDGSAGETAAEVQHDLAVAGAEAARQLADLAHLGVLFHIDLQGELFGREERVFFVKGSMVEQPPGRDSQGFGDGLDDVGGGVLATLLDVSQVALGYTGFIGQGLQSEFPFHAEAADGRSYVVCESPAGHTAAPARCGLASASTDDGCSV